jgi:hypothetical protein
MLLEPLGTRVVVKVGLNDDRPGSIARVAKGGENAPLAIKPHAHCGEDIGQIGMLNGYLDGM